MKRFVLVMLCCITTASSVFADALDAGLGADRASLSLEQIAVRSDLLEASTSFSLLRFPEARLAPGRIFKPEIWKSIEAAAREYDLDPMILAGMIFIESYGDPMAKSPTGPAGIAQMTKGSARELGLSTGRKVRIGSKTVTRTRWVGKGKNRRKVVRTVQQPIYKTIDERYVPARAISAMARRLNNRRAWLGGKIDFAIAEYHMGAGRMAKLLSAYYGETVKVSDVTARMSGTTLTYPELYWTNTPYFRADVYEALEDLNEVDFSPTYYFRVRQAMRLLSTYRQAPEEYARLASAYQGKFGWAVLPSWQWSFVTEPFTNVVDAPPPTGVLHQDAGERFALLPDIAASFGVRTGSIPMSAERSTIGSALFIAQQLKRLQGDRYNGFEISRMLTQSFAGCSGIGTSAYDGDEDDQCAPLHTLGWAFDVTAGKLSKTDQRDLKFVLTDLRQAGLLAYVEDDKQPTYHIVRHPDHAARFEQFFRDVMTGATPADERRVAYRISEPVVVTVTAALNDSEPDLGISRAPNVFGALTALFSRIYDYFA